MSYSPEQVRQACRDAMKPRPEWDDLKDWPNVAPEPIVEELRPFRPAVALLALPAFARQFSDVPDQYVERTEESATIACPCGNRPSVGFGALHTCDCERVFFHGVTVKVAGGPRSEWMAQAA